MNQIRAWVRQGRTDAWIAHQIEVPASELREFRRRHGLTANGEEVEEDLRDEIEAEIEAATQAEAEPAVDADEDDEDEDEAGDDQEAEVADDADGAAEPAAPRRRRRRRRRGSGSGKSATLQATFDHGDQDGVGLWLDPAVKDQPVYSEHWAGHRPVEVSIEPDRITIRRSNTGE